jgi:hypothetical protein
MIPLVLSTASMFVWVFVVFATDDVGVREYAMIRLEIHWWAVLLCSAVLAIEKQKVTKINFGVMTNKVGSECEEIVEIDTDEWDAMSGEDKDNYVIDLVFNEVDWWYKEIDDDDQ